MAPFLILRSASLSFRWFLYFLCHVCLELPPKQPEPPSPTRSPSTGAALEGFCCPGSRRVRSRSDPGSLILCHPPALRPCALGRTRTVPAPQQIPRLRPGAPTPGAIRFLSHLGLLWFLLSVRPSVCPCAEGSPPPAPCPHLFFSDPHPTWGFSFSWLYRREDGFSFVSSASPPDHVGIVFW